MIKLLRLALAVFIAAQAPGNVTPALAQEQVEDDSVKAVALIRDAIKMRGGDAYLSIRTLVSRGQFTPFDKGASGLPMSFVDYIVYPDRERTEFDKGDRKYVQTNSGNTGWIYEAQQKRIRDQTEQQVKGFQQGNRYDIDNLLRRGWQEPGVKLVYLGRREAWRNTFSEAVRIDFADGASATLHFDPRSKLLMMSEYKMLTEDGTTNNQVRYFRWVDFNGVQFPQIQDSYRDGQQTARVYYETINFNVNIPDSLFAKPASIKEVK